MHILTLLVLVLFLGHLSNPLVITTLETVHDAARLARQLVHDTGVGTLMTTMASTEFAGHPFGLMDYYADECSSTGDVILLISGLQINARNFAKDNRVTLSIRSLQGEGSPMAEKRVALLGEILRTGDDEFKTIKDCFVAKHSDARAWLPDGKTPFHDFHFYRLRVKGIYYVGGFGGLHYIGWVPEETYHAARPQDGREMEGRFTIQTTAV